MQKTVKYFENKQPNPSVREVSWRERELVQLYTLHVHYPECASVATRQYLVAVAGGGGEDAYS